jgi:hypothetical protein
MMMSPAASATISESLTITLIERDVAAAGLERHHQLHLVMQCL